MNIQMDKGKSRGEKPFCVALPCLLVLGGPGFCSASLCLFGGPGFCSTSPAIISNIPTTPIAQRMSRRDNPFFPPPSTHVCGLTPGGIPSWSVTGDGHFDWCTHFFSTMYRYRSGSDSIPISVRVISARFDPHRAGGEGERGEHSRFSPPPG